MVKQLAIGILLAASPAAAAPTGQIVERELHCPACGKPFYAQLDVSGAHSEMRLDLKPVGELSGPWLLPDCPACGFVTYRLPVPPAELPKCRQLVNSGDYKRHFGRSSYYRVGLIYQKLGKPDFLLAGTFLKASWQEENDPAKLKEDLELSLRYFTSCAATCAAEERENSQLLIGELLRRLGRFEKAIAHLSALQKANGFQKNFFADVVEYQLKLCAKMDSEPHDMQDVKDFKKTAFTRLKEKLKKFVNYLGSSL